MFSLIAVGANTPPMSRVVNELPLDAEILDCLKPGTNLHLQFASKALGKWKTTFLKRIPGFMSPVAKWKCQPIPSLTGHMMIFITAPWDERQVRETMLQCSPGGLTTDYCNRLKVT